MTSISDTNVVNAPGGLVELGYKEVTSPVTVTGTQGSQTTIVSPMSIVCDGSPVFIEFFSPYIQYGSTAGNWCVFSLWVDGVLESHISENFYFANSLGNFDGGPGVGFRRLTPSAGVHTFEIRAWRNNANVTVGTGSGYSPIYLRVSKVIQASQLIVQTPNAPLVTSLPSNAIDGQEVRYLADNTNGIIWNFRYRAGSSSAYKWEFIGGPPIHSKNAGTYTLSLPSAYNYGLTGPSLSLPLAGDWIIESHGRASPANSTTWYAWVWPSAQGNDFWKPSLFGANEWQYISQRTTGLGLPVNDTVQQAFSCAVNSATIYYRTATVMATPIRVSA